MKFMRPLIIALFLFISFINLKAQSILYFKQPELNKFAGTWEYKSGDTTFLLVLKNVKTFVKGGNAYLDLIQAKYSLKKNGQIICSSLEATNIHPSGSFVDRKKTIDEIHILLDDVCKNKRGDMIFELLNDNNDEAKWTLTNTEGMRLGYYDYTFSMPLHMILKRVK